MFNGFTSLFRVRMTQSNGIFFSSNKSLITFVCEKQFDSMIIRFFVTDDEIQGQILSVRYFRVYFYSILEFKQRRVMRSDDNRIDDFTSRKPNNIVIYGPFKQLGFRLDSVQGPFIYYVTLLFSYVLFDLLEYHNFIFVARRFVI